MNQDAVKKLIGVIFGKPVEPTIESTTIFGRPVESPEMEDALNRVLGTIQPRQRTVLELRFGLLDGRSRTLREIGDEFGVTGERIRQIEAKALRRLRKSAMSLVLLGSVSGK